MIDRASFDQQISEIRNRYDKIIHQKEQATQENGPKAGLLTYRPEEMNPCFSTPIKTNKNHGNEHLTSFSKFKQAQELLENYKIKGLNTNSLIKNFEIGRKKYQEQRTCQTSREYGSRNKELSAKLTEQEKILVERMKENEKILRKSKQLREGESKGKNCVAFDKNTSLGREERYFEYVRAKDKENMMLGKKICLGFTHTQETQRSAETERLGRLDKTSTLLLKGDMKTNEEPTSLRSALKERINFYSKERMEKREDFTKCKDNFENNEKNLGLTPLRLQARKDCQEEPTKQSELKMKSVFQNTAQIQERIKALLSFH